MGSCCFDLTRWFNGNRPFHDVITVVSLGTLRNRRAREKLIIKANTVTPDGMNRSTDRQRVMSP